MSESVRPHRWQPTRLPCPWDSPGKNTGVGCHVLLQCMKVKSESEVTQSCPTLSDPMDCSLPGSSIHGIFRARVLEWGAIAFSENMLSLLQTPLSFALSKTLPTVVLIFKDMTFLRSFLVLSPKYISLGTIVWFCSVSFSFWCMRAKSLQS